MTGFIGSENKSLVRSGWDRLLIADHFGRLGRPLAYFGLPGPDIEDLLDWGEYLGFCTGVERLRKTPPSLHTEDLAVHHRLINNVMLNGIWADFELLRGQVEDIILHGVDVDGKRPRVAHGDPAWTAEFGYDLVNLDFTGGLGYRRTDDPRILALRKLLERQRNHSFLLLLTINVRDKLRDRLTSYLDGAKGDADGELAETLGWYASLEESRRAHKLKVVVPLFLKREAAVQGFECYCHPPVNYQGTGDERMVHFVFRLEPTRGTLHGFSPQRDRDVIDLALMEARDGRFHVADPQHPRFDYSACEAQIAFLPESIRPASIVGPPHARDALPS